MLKWNKKRKGFTLIELVIVIAILGILAMFAVPKYQGLVREARSAEARAQLGTVRSALSIYYAKNHGKFPASIDGSLFSEGTVPYVEITDTAGNVLKNNNVAGAATCNGDGIVQGSETTGVGGWIYDNGANIDAADGGPFSQADVRLNSIATDPGNGGTTPWYKY